MDFKNINVSEVLRIENVELFRTKGEKATRLHQGDLSLLYSKDHDWYILKIKEWNYGLNKDIPLLASSQEQDSIRSYVLADLDGYFVIKIARGHYGDLDRLEAILKQNSQFACKENADGHGLPVEINHGTVKVKRNLSEGNADAQEPFTLAHTVYTGGKNARDTMINTAEVISLNLTKFGDYLQTNVLPKPEEKKINPKTVSRLNWVNSATGMVNSASTFYIKGLMSLSKSIAQKLETKYEKKKFEKEVVQIQEEHEKNMAPKKKDDIRFTGNLVHATLHAGIGLWHGMLEALDIIREGFTKATTDAITHSYGQGAGELFEAGVGIVGNVGLPGARYLKMANKINTVTKIANKYKA